MRERTEAVKANRPGRTPVHPYDKWLTKAEESEHGIDLFKGEDFKSTVTTMRHNLYRVASDRGFEYKTATLTDDDGEATGISLEIWRPTKSKKTTK